MGERFKLNSDQVAELRTSDLPDRVFAERWHVNRQSIHHARTGKNWAKHPVPPQTVRRRGGRWREKGISRGFNTSC
jgi:hypothetical protein